MVIDVNRTIAYRCPSCGDVRMLRITPFNTMPSSAFYCSCGEECLTLDRQKDTLSITSGCVMCEESHNWMIKVKNFWRGKSYVLRCRYSGIALIFIGEEEQVKEQIKESEEMIEKILDPKKGEDG